MFSLHLSNRTENLIARLVEVLTAQPRRDLFAREYFLIQSQGMERMLSQRLADAFPVWCNFEYLLPTRFFDHLAARLGMAVNPEAFDREALAWRIDALLAAIARQPQLEKQPQSPALFAPILRYLNGEQAALKRFQLARELANLFDQYQIMRPEMLEGWKQGKRATTNPAEAWQMALWAQLGTALDHSPHRGEMLRLLIKQLHDRDDLGAILPERLSIFGLHSMPPLLLDGLHGVSRHCDVHLYLLSPCQHYWADIPQRRRLIRENLARLQQGFEPIPLDPEIHPLLGSLGRQGQDFQAMLLERIDELADTESFADPASPGSDPPCLLHRLQSDLLAGGWNEHSLAEPLPLDSSLTLASCHSPARELMVLKDQILRRLQDNPGLELRDIVVMAPDIQEYAAIIPAVFHDIQHSIADRSLRRRNRVLAVFLQFLDLAASRCPWSAVMDLLEQPEICANLPDFTEADIELVRHWVTNSGIRWGLSPEQLQAMGLSQATETTWRAGLDRLLLGYAMEWDAPVDGILPYGDIEGSQARALGPLCRFIELLTQAASELARPRPLAAWSPLLLSYSEALFRSDMGDDLVRLREMLSDLAIRFGAFHHPDVPLEVIQAWLETTAAESRTSAGFLRGRLTFCSMLPMRSIPFRMVCLLGLNDGVFPKTDRHPPFDLLGEGFRPGDRSRRGDDRYQFLEALLSARQALYLSHVGQSIRTGRDIPPSVLISELMETLRLAYGIENPLVRHPLQPFSPRYFGHDTLFSFSTHHCEVARALSHPQPAATAAPWWSGTLAPAEEQSVKITDLLAFFTHPQRWFVRNRLDIHLDTETELPEENEPFSVAGLDAYLIDQELIASCLAGGTQDAAALLASLQARGRWMLGTPGRLAFERRLPGLATFAARLQGLDMGEKLPDLPVDLTIDGCRLTGLLSAIHDKGILLARYSECKGKDLLRAWIHHLLLAAACPDRPGMTRLLTKDRELSFGPCPDPRSHLCQLLAIFRRGCASPSPLVVEPAWIYVQQQENDRAQTPPLLAAHKALKRSMENGYEPEICLLYGAEDPAGLLGPEFEQLCLDFFRPIFAAADRGWSHVAQAMNGAMAAGGEH